MEAFKIKPNEARKKEDEVIDKLEKAYAKDKRPQDLVALEFLQLHLQSQLVDFDTICRDHIAKGVEPHMIVDQVLRFTGSMLVQYATLYGNGAGKYPMKLVEAVAAFQTRQEVHVAESLAAVISLQLRTKG